MMKFVILIFALVVLQCSVYYIQENRREKRIKLVLLTHRAFDSFGEALLILLSNYTDSKHNHRDDEEEYFGVVHYDVSSEAVTESARKKREILSSTRDGVPIVSESYVERKRLNTPSSKEKLTLYETLEKLITNVNQQSSYKTTTAPTMTFRRSQELEDPSPTSILRRTSRVMKTDDERSKTIRKMIKTFGPRSAENSREINSNLQEQVESAETIVYPSNRTLRRRQRRYQNRQNLETMDDRHYPAIHFNGDYTNCRKFQESHCKGNGHLQHPHGFRDWSAASWAETLGFDRNFKLHHEHLTVKTPGLYVIYAQIFYSTTHDQNGYKIEKNGENIAQCTVTTHSVHDKRHEKKSNTCFTATVDYLSKDDILRVRDIGNDRTSIFETGKSFFGLFKISDLKIRRNP